MKGKKKVCRKVSKTLSDDSTQLHTRLPKKFLTLLSFPSKIQKGHDFSSCSARTRADNTPTKLQASHNKQFATAIITHMSRFVCMYQTPNKGQGSSICLLTRPPLRKQSTKTRETPTFIPTKEELSKEKHPLNSKAGSAPLYAAHSRSA